MDTPEELDFISERESKLIDKLTRKLLNHIPKNEVRRDLKESKNKLKNLRIAIPRAMEGVNIVVAWARVAVQALVKRTILNLIKDNNNPWLERAWKDHQLKLKAKQVQEDSYTYGIGFLLFGAGTPEEGFKSLVTVESPFTTTVTFTRSGELAALLKVEFGDDGHPEEGFLYLPNEAIHFSYKPIEGVHNITFNSPYGLVARYPTGIPFVPAQAFPNNPDGSDFSGRSEITPSLISAIDGAMRTLAQGEYSKEIYSHPQRALLDVDPKDAKAIKQHGLPTPVDGVWAFERKEVVSNDPLKGTTFAPATQIQQLDAASPTPFIDWIKTYAQQVSGETGIPLARLGYPLTNPSSADALRAEETELVRNANMRRDVFDAYWNQFAIKLFFIEFGRFPEPGELDFQSVWEKPDVQTPAADMDQAVKLSQIDASAPGARVILRRAGLTESEIDEMIAEATDVAVLKSSINTLSNAAKQMNPILAKLAEMNYDPDAEEDEETEV
jgi:hypothetical protein